MKKDIFMTGDFLDRVNELGRIIDVARLYFERDLTQKEIAKKKKISQSEVSRLLKTARKEKLIHTTISAGFDLALESKLLAKFPDLDEVFVCYVTKDTSEKKTFEKDLLQILGHKGAEYLVQNVKHSNKIGLSCGRTLNTVARNLDLTSKRLDISLPALCKVYALVHPCIDEVVDPTPASIVSTAVRQLPDSIGYAYQFPSIGKPVDSQMSFKTFYREQINDLENRMADLDAYFVGIGHVNFNSTGAVARQGVGLQFNALIASLGLTEALKEMGAVGEIDFQPYNEAGEISD